MQTDFEIPKTIAVCPCCGTALSLEVNEWESKTGAPTEAGCYVDCEQECTLGYGTGVALTHRVWLWAKDHVVVGPDAAELRARMAEFAAGVPMKGGMGR